MATVGAKGNLRHSMTNSHERSLIMYTGNKLVSILSLWLVVHPDQSWLLAYIITSKLEFLRTPGPHANSMCMARCELLASKLAYVLCIFI